MTSLRRVFLVTILSGVFVALLVSGAAVFFVASAGTRSQLDKALLARAATFASLVVEEQPDPHDSQDESGLVFDYKGTLLEEDTGVLVQIRDDRDRVLASSPTWPEHVRLSPASDVEDLLVDVDLGDDVPARLVVISRHATSEEDPPAVSQHRITIGVIERRAAAARAEAALLAALIAGGLVAAMGTAIAVSFGVRRGLKPVRTLCAELRGTDASEPAPMSAPTGYPRELQPIVGALDELLARVRTALERERCFTDAAAHELRTPIAELRTIIDVAERWPDPHRLRNALGETRAIVNEMEALITVLLAVARGGHAYEHQPAHPIALLPLVRAILENRKPDLDARRVAITLEGDESAAWTGPAGAVQVIVRNILDNAAEYTPAGGSIKVSVGPQEKGAFLQVENGPVTLAPENVGRIFEPFWRSDVSRSDRAHRGLGLAIVAALAEGLSLSRDAVVTDDRRFRLSLTT